MSTHAAIVSRGTAIKDNHTFFMSFLSMHWVLGEANRSGMLRSVDGVLRRRRSSVGPHAAQWRHPVSHAARAKSQRYFITRRNREIVSATSGEGRLSVLRSFSHVKSPCDDGHLYHNRRRTSLGDGAHRYRSTGFSEIGDADRAPAMSIEQIAF
jgi:hypothetical protein